MAHVCPSCNAACDCGVRDPIFDCKHCADINEEDDDDDDFEDGDDDD